MAASQLLKNTPSFEVRCNDNEGVGPIPEPEPLRNNNDEQPIIIGGVQKVALY